VTTEVIELSSSDPSVATVVAGSDVPLDDADTAGSYVVGTGPGQATLTLKARFDDGSIRQATATIQVKATDSIKIRAICSDGYPVSDVVLPVGDQISFTVELYAGTDPLVGLLPNAVTGDGVALKVKSFGDSPRPFVWQAPATPAVVQLQSAYVSKVIGSLTAFTQAQVTDIGMQVYREDYRNAFTESERERGQGGLSLPTTVIVDGKASCAALPVELYSATPAICTGPNGETDWGTSPWGGEVSVHGEGTCVLSASMQGRPIVAAKSFPVFFVTDGLDLSAAAGACSIEGQTACQSGYVGVERCKSGAWIADPHCAADQVCDAAPASSAACTTGAACTHCRGLVDVRTTGP
jgi:hypothetical protein